MIGFSHIISYVNIEFQKRHTEQNYMLINLILSEFAIAFFGVPFDLVGSITKGDAITKSFCLIQGFIHTFFGKQHLIEICNLDSFFSCFYLIILSMKYFDTRYELFIYHYGNGYCKIFVCCEIGTILAQQYKLYVLDFAVYTFILVFVCDVCRTSPIWLRAICEGCKQDLVSQDVINGIFYQQYISPNSVEHVLVGIIILSIIS